MIVNYIKLTFRNLFKNPGFSSINILGLGIGMAASILISLWIFDELSYDRYHKNADRIYRLEREIIQNNESRMIPITAAVYANHIEAQYPQVENSLRLIKRNYAILNEKNIAVRETIFFAEKSFFDIFSIPLIKGDPLTILTEPKTLVLTKTGAQKYFGDEDPINQSLTFDISGQKINYMVKGVMEDIPENSHFHFDILASFSTLVANQMVDLNSWNDNKLYTYLLLKKGADSKQVEERLQEMVTTYVDPARILMFGGKKPSSDIILKLQPITKIHFNDASNYAIEPNRNKNLIYLFSFFSLLVLAMASFNYVNLSTAIAGKRSLEVGVRKTMGAAKKQLIFQFIGESVILSMVALAIAFLLMEITLPFFNDFTNKSLSLASIFSGKSLLFIFLVVFVTGFLSGIYPAFYLSSFKPLTVLKGKSWGGLNKLSLRQILVITQFTISIALIIGAITANLQLKYFRNKPLGFERENVLIIQTGDKYARQHFEPFRNELLQQKFIKNVCSSSNIPTSASVSDNFYGIDTYPGEKFTFWFYSIDENFIKTYGIDLLAGSDFAKEHFSNTENKCIVNESVISILGFKNPQDAIGKTITHFGYNGDKQELIVGVVADYHLLGLDQKIRPMVHYFSNEASYYISIKYENAENEEILKMVENIWTSQFPQAQFSSSFLENRYNNLYVNERKINQLLIAFTLLAIFIACMGLFGLAAYIVQQRTKEIGIRKVHGAPNISIINLLNGVFIKWVLIANIISWPIAYYLLDEWLAGFYYRVDLPLWVFLISGAMGLLIAVATVSYQASIAARSNPIDSLRFE